MMERSLLWLTVFKILVHGWLTPLICGLQWGSLSAYSNIGACVESKLVNVMAGWDTKARGRTIYCLTLSFKGASPEDLRLGLTLKISTISSPSKLGIVPSTPRLLATICIETLVPCHQQRVGASNTDMLRCIRHESKAGVIKMTMMWSSP